MAGQKRECIAILEKLVGAGCPVEKIYTDLFQGALYQIGELWEQNRISVATEHMATSLVESLMIYLQSRIFNTERIGKKAVVACVVREYHQIGAKMVADIFEMHGWDSFFIGANTPVDEPQSDHREPETNPHHMEHSTTHSGIEYCKKIINGHRGSFMSSLFLHYEPRVLVETVLWVFRACRNHGFKLTYWPAQLDNWLSIFRNEMSTEAHAEIEPFYHWMIVNNPAFALLSENQQSDAVPGGHSLAR